jgi:hypothetical protein
MGPTESDLLASEDRAAPIQPTLSVESASNIRPTLSDELPPVQVSQLTLSATVQTLSRRFPLGWSHYVELLTLDNTDERRFYSNRVRCPPRVTIQIEQTRGQRGHFNLIHCESGFKADIYLAGADSLHSWGLARRNLAEFEGDQISFAPPEYVILRKLQFYREGKSAKHLRDIHRIINILGPEWYIQERLILIREHHVEPEW